MLLRFGVENHRSIASYQELLMTASTLKDNEEGLLFVNDIERGASTKAKELRINPVAALYGANAAGKSTLLDAFGFFVRGVLRSHTRVASSKGTGYSPFMLDDESRNSPSRYDADFIIEDVRYHYGYTVDGDKVVSEWLYSFQLNASRQVKSILFLRETLEDASEVVLEFGKSLKGENKQISKFVRSNSLFLSVAAQNAHPQLSKIYEYFEKNISSKSDAAENFVALNQSIVEHFSENRELREKAIKFLNSADIGIVDLKFTKNKIPKDKNAIDFLKEVEAVFNKHFPGSSEDDKSPFWDKNGIVSARFQHMGAGGKVYPISLSKESAGTISLLNLIGPAFLKLATGGLLVVDEINSTLHPLVSRELIRLFSDPKSNPGKAQLIFSTHDTNLLCGRMLRRDQVWFAEKDDAGATHIYPLSDIKIRANDDFEKGYLTGRFGAIPFTGQMNSDENFC